MRQRSVTASGYYALHARNTAFTGLSAAFPARKRYVRRQLISLDLPTTW